MLLGMLWHKRACPTAKQTTKTVTGDDFVLHSLHDFYKSVMVAHLSVKRFRSMPQKKGEKISDVFGVFQIRNGSSYQKAASTPPAFKVYDTKDQKIIALLLFFRCNQTGVFLWTTPMKAVDRVIEIDPSKRPPNRPPLRLSSADLAATKKCKVDILSKRKFRSSHSPFGAPLCCIKPKGKLRGVIDYCTLNQI